MEFWIIAIALATLISLALVFALRVQAPQSDDDVDLKVYKDQLSNVDRDVERGIVSEQEAQRLRTEVSRRILSLDGDERAAYQTSSAMTRYAVSALCGGVLIAGTAWLYSKLGAPGYPDMPLDARKEQAQTLLETRPSQAEFLAQLPASVEAPLPEGQYGELIIKLREAVEQNPNDLQGHILLARTEASLENFEQASQAQGRVLTLKGESATAEDYFDYAEMQILAANGYISPQAEAALRAVLTRDRDYGAARYYMGLMMVQNGRPDLTFRVWNDLLRKSEPSDPWMPPLRAQIEEIAALAGQINFVLPEEDTALSGPSAKDIAEASDLSPEERQEMVRGMVSQLSDRLATEGGTSAEWARLISALSVLGDQDQAIAILAEARQIFGQSPRDLSAIEAAARQAGLRE